MRTVNLLFLILLALLSFSAKAEVKLLASGWMKTISEHGFSNNLKNTSIHYNTEDQSIIVSQYPVSLELSSSDDLHTILSQGSFVAPTEDLFPLIEEDQEKSVQKLIMQLSSVTLAQQGLRLELNQVPKCAPMNDEEESFANFNNSDKGPPCPDVMPASSANDYCSYDHATIRNQSCYSDKFDLINVAIVSPKAAHYDLLALKVQESLAQSVILPCASCSEFDCVQCKSKPSEKKRKKIFNKLLLGDPVEIEGFGSAKDFISAYRLELEEYIQDRAHEYKRKLELYENPERGGRKRLREWSQTSEKFEAHISKLESQLIVRGKLTQQVLRSNIPSQASEAITVTKIENLFSGNSYVGKKLSYKKSDGSVGYYTYEPKKNENKLIDENGAEVVLTDPFNVTNYLPPKRRGRSVFSNESFEKKRNEFCEPLLSFNTGEASRLKRVWGIQNESWWQRVLKYPFRLVYHTADRTIRSRTTNSALNLLRGDFSNSTINPLLTAHNAGMDLGRLMTVPIDAAFAETSRIEICTSNLVFNFFGQEKLSSRALATINPMLHVGVIIDDQYETRDLLMEDSAGSLINARSKDDVYCHKLSIRSNEPEPVVLERLRCLNEVFGGNMNYSFVGYNCGGYTKDILEAAGLSYPLLVNMMVGSNLNSRSPEDTLNLENAKEYCENHIRLSRLLINALENQTVTEQLLNSFEENLNNPPANTGGGFSGKRLYHPGHDLILQLMVSSAKNSDPTIQKRMDSFLNQIKSNALSRDGDRTKPVHNLRDGAAFFSVYVDEKGIKPQYKKHLQKIFGKLTPAQVERLAPEARELAKVLFNN